MAAKSAPKWVVGLVAGTGAIILAPLLIIGLVIMMMLGPLARQAALDDRNLGYCDVARNYTNDLPDDDPDPFWCHAEDYCPAYESPLSEADIAAAGITRIKTVQKEVEKQIEVTTPAPASPTPPTKPPGVPDYYWQMFLDSLPPAANKPVTTTQTVTETVNEDVTVTALEDELTDEELLEVRLLRAVDLYPELEAIDIEFLPELCDVYFGRGFSLAGGWAGGQIGASLAALPKSPITNISTAGARPQTLAFAEAIYAKFGRPIVSLFRPGATVHNNGKTPSDHGAGNAIDVGVTGDFGYEIMGWVWQAHYEGIVPVKYTIYNRQIYLASNGFRPQPYSCNGTANDCHTNHVHISLIG